MLAVGNPGGRGIVYSQGIVSCASMDPTWPSVLNQTVQEGSILKLSPDEFVRGSKDNYAVVFRGYLEFPNAGLYRVILTSDDGSKCYLNDRLIINNDYGHPPQPMARLVRVPAGLVPIRMEYFQGRGGRALTLQLKREGGPESEGTFYRD